MLKDKKIILKNFVFKSCLKIICLNMILVLENYLKKIFLNWFVLKWPDWTLNKNIVANLFCSGEIFIFVVGNFWTFEVNIANYIVMINSKVVLITQIFKNWWEIGFNQNIERITQLDLSAKFQGLTGLRSWILNNQFPAIFSSIFGRWAPIGQLF